MQLAINPELHKNIWLELSPQRLILAPLTLLGVGYLTWRFDGYRLGDQTQTTFWVIFQFTLFLWGSRQAADTIIQESLHRTWDGQRLSAQSPWSLVWGKLFGGTIFSWYIALMALAVMVAGPAVDRGHRGVGELIFTALVTGVTCHALVIGLLLLAVQRLRVHAHINLGRSAIGGTVIGVLFLFVGGVALPRQMAWPEMVESVRWFGWIVSGSSWRMINWGLLLAWTLLGVYRLMRLELGIVNGPTAWLSFNLFSVFYAAGYLFHRERDLLGPVVISGAMMSTTWAYLMIFLEPKDPIWLSRLQDWATTGDWRKVRDHLPCWAISAGLAIVLGIVGITVVPTSSAVMISGQAWWAEAATVSSPRAFLVAVMLFMVRDLLLILLLNLGSRTARADGTALFYLVILYGLLPMMVLASAGSRWGKSAWIPLFYPSPTSDPLATILAPLVEVAGLVWWGRRWMRGANLKEQP